MKKIYTKKHGEVAVIDGDTHIGAWVEQTGRLDHDQWSLRKICAHIRPGETVVDVGAYIGDHTIAYAEAVGAAGRVVALEPNPAAFECLQWNLRNHQQVQCLQLGASDSEHQAAMHLQENGGASWMVEGEGVRTTTIDALELPSCSLIKLDCEGYEVRALTGARETILRHRPVLVFEVNEGALARQGTTPGVLLGMVRTLGYQLRNLDRSVQMAGLQYDAIATPTP